MSRIAQCGYQGSGSFPSLWSPKCDLLYGDIKIVVKTGVKRSPQHAMGAKLDVSRALRYSFIALQKKAIIIWSISSSTKTDHKRSDRRSWQGLARAVPW